jgi:hypothetical protein
MTCQLAWRGGKLRRVLSWPQSLWTPSLRYGGTCHATNPSLSWDPDWSQCYPYARPICAPDFNSNFKSCNALLDPISQKAEDVICPHIWEDAESANPDLLTLRGKTIGTVCYRWAPNFEGTYVRERFKNSYNSPRTSITSSGISI